MEKYGLIIFIIGLIASILLFLVIKYNHFQWIMIKLDKGEVSIYGALEKKYNLLLRYLDFLKNSINVDETEFEEYKLLNMKSPINKINKKITSMENLINKYMDNNEKLLKNETIINLNKDLISVDISINGGKKYYNENLIHYNKLVHSFPSKIVAKLFKYHEKEFLDEEVKEELKILDK